MMVGRGLELAAQTKATTQPSKVPRLPRSALDWDARVAEFEQRGFRLVQMGKWQGRVPFGYFVADDAPGLVIETVLFPDDFVMPAPERRFPA
jgi:hypothetical protein